MTPASLSLVRPTAEHLPSFVAALERGWNPPGTTAAEVLAAIERDAATFLALQHDPDAKAPPVKLPDGSIVERLPGITRWMWDGEFCGRISLRWQHGTVDLPPTCLGHVGYVVVPWKRQRGYATASLAQILPDARALGLPYVELTTDLDNLYSQRVIAANGGVLHEQFTRVPQLGGGDGYRFRIAL